ncbi:MAG: peptidyl-prolyl cis-trans isomerase [Deltaproteobacteria bacterium]|nr:peptidyl-prolyl cis-trans isomerase [Deltaproteobacteria bacterium]
MARRLIPWVLFLLIFGACTHFDPETVTATLDGVPIKAREVQQALEREKEKYSPEKLRSRADFLKIKEKTLGEIIDRRLLLKEATAQGTFISEEEFQDELRKYKSNYTEVSFQKMLQERGISNEAWLQLRRESFIVSKFLSGAGPEDHDVDQEAVKKYYDEHSDEFKIPETVHVRQIVTDTKEKAESILRRLRQGENFAKLARDLSLSPDRSEGGDLGFIPRGSFPREFEVCFTMNPGEISPIIPSLYGFHLFKVIEKAPGRTLDLTEVSQKIFLQLKQQSREKYMKTLLERLRSQAKIEINRDVLERMTL